MREVSEAARRVIGRLPEDQLQLRHRAGDERALPRCPALFGEVGLDPPDRAPGQVADHLTSATPLGPPLWRQPRGKLMVSLVNSHANYT